MKLFSGLFGSRPKAATQSASGGRRYSADDPMLLEEIRRKVNGSVSADVMKNDAINRAMRLLSESIGMLPAHLVYRDKSQSGDTKGRAVNHQVDRLLHRRPNNWQTPLEFKRLMQAVLLRDGIACAQIVRSRDRIIQLQPLAKFVVEPRQNIDWTMSYDVTNRNGVKTTFRQSEIFAIRDLDLVDGVKGSSRLKQASEAIDLAKAIRTAAQKLFDNNMQPGGSLSTDRTLSEDARANLKASMSDREGADNAGKWLLLEEGLKAEIFGKTLEESLQTENLSAQIEAIARIFGTPRPLLMMDETSWGSGIDSLAIFFVTYGLLPQFTNWEQAVERDLLTLEEAEEYQLKFNEAALLRGSMKDQADFFAKALGSGGHQPWMTVNEVRGYSDYSDVEGGDALPERAGAKTGASNEPAQTA